MCGLKVSTTSLKIPLSSKWELMWKKSISNPPKETTTRSVNLTPLVTHWERAVYVVQKCRPQVSKVQPLMQTGRGEQRTNLEESNGECFNWWPLNANYQSSFFPSLISSGEMCPQVPHNRSKLLLQQNLPLWWSLCSFAKCIQIDHRRVLDKFQLAISPSSGLSHRRHWDTLLGKQTINCQDCTRL